MIGGGFDVFENYARLLSVDGLRALAKTPDPHINQWIEAMIKRKEQEQNSSEED